MRQKRFRRRLPRQGYTLVELVLSIAVVGIVLVGFTVSQLYLVERAEATLVEQERRAWGGAALAEIEQGVRASEAILKAGDGMLEISTRYFLNIDDTLETVRYSLEGGVLYRRTAVGASSFGSPEAMLEGVSSFSALSYEIHDSFPRSTYDDAELPTGGPRLLNGLTKVKYDLKDIGGLDAELVEAWDDEFERLEVVTTSAVKTVTITPPMPKNGLEAKVRFYPLAAPAEYRPLIYGAEEGDGIALVFEPDFDVKLRMTDSGNVDQEAATGLTWSEEEQYRLTLRISANQATAWLDRGAGMEEIGSVAAGSFDDKELHMQVGSGNGAAAFDDVEVSYPYVQLELVIDHEGVTETLAGGATRRQP